MIDLKKFDKKKITKPAGELTPNDVGSLVKFIDINGCEVSDILASFVAGNGVHVSGRAVPKDAILVTLEHIGQWNHDYFAKMGIYVLPGMRVVVQRPVE